MTDIIPSDYWYTPPYVLNCVDKFLGNLHFDPCPIDPYFDGLSVQWRADSFINPPYSADLRRAFVQKGIEQFNRRTNARFLWLLNYGNNKDLWELHKRSSATCIPEKRIKFIPGHPDLGDGKSPRYDSIFILWGNPQGFKDAFKEIGKVHGDGA